MASSKEYHDFLMEQLGAGAKSRAMMGEYVLYYNGKIFGGIYDDRLLVKPVAAAIAAVPYPKMELPYPGAKEMLLIEEVDNREFLRSLLQAMWAELPEPKKKGK